MKGVKNDVLEGLAGGVFVLLAYYWIRSRDSNINKLQKVFETNNLKAGDQIPMFSKKKGNVYLFRMPVGLTFDAIKDKLQAFKDAFPDKAIDISFNKALRIVIADPLPESITFEETDKKGWRIPLGKAIESTIYHDITKYPHLLVAGMTRYGKTVLLKLIICSIVLIKPQSSQFVLLDLKGGLAFNRFRKLKQTKTVAGDVNQSLAALKVIKNEVEKRQAYFLANYVEKIEELKAPYQRIFVIIDEAAELTSQGRKGKEAVPYRECERLLDYIARVGAGLGIHLIYCTQYPTKETLPQQVKQNCDATLSFQLRNSTASKVVFDETNKAEKLPHIRGRAIYRTDKDIELQVFNIDNEKINEIIEANKREEVVIDEQSTDEGNEAGGDTVIFR